MTDPRTPESLPAYYSDIPENVLVLHTPWATQEGRSDFVGRLKVGTGRYAGWYACNELNEERGLVPRVIDHFLSWAITITSSVWTDHISLFDQYKVKDVGLHEHMLDHGHKKVLRDWAPARAADEKDIGGQQVTVSAPLHEHAVTLQSTDIKVGLERVFDPAHPERPIYITDAVEPHHQEVNAYFTREPAPIPPGTIVFYPGTDRLSGWQCLTTHGITPGAHDRRSPQNDRWATLLMKVVDCFPKRYRRGFETHSHAVPNHVHDVGEDDAQIPVSGKAGGTVLADANSSGSPINTATQGHTHRLEKLKEFVGGQTSPAPNMPRHVGYAAYVAIAERPRFYRGMMVPFVPDTPNDIEAALTCAFAQGWVLADKPVDDADQLFICSLNDGIGLVSGKTTHRHDYVHAHRVSMRADTPRQPTRVDPGDDLDVGTSGHTHRDVKLWDRVTSSEGETVLPAREVNFLRFEG